MINACPYCGAKNRQGILFCEDCGKGLYDKTDELTIPGRNGSSSLSQEMIDAREGYVPLGDDQALVMYIRNAKAPITIDTTHAVTIGRKGRGVAPDLDLTPYGALEKGVSRVHAVIQVVDNIPVITDVGSTNGLYLNGNQIPTETSQILCDGDELHLGELVVHIYFE